MEVTGQCQVSFSITLYLFVIVLVRLGLLLSPELTDWLPRKLQRVSCLCFSDVGVIRMHSPFLALSVDLGNQALVLVLGFQALH